MRPQKVSHVLGRGRRRHKPITPSRSFSNTPVNPKARKDNSFEKNNIVNEPTTPAPHIKRIRMKNNNDNIINNNNNTDINNNNVASKSDKYEPQGEIKFQFNQHFSPHNGTTYEQNLHITNPICPISEFSQNIRRSVKQRKLYQQRKNKLIKDNLKEQINEQKSSMSSFALFPWVLDGSISRAIGTLISTIKRQFTLHRRHHQYQQQQQQQQTNQQQQTGQQQQTNQQHIHNTTNNNSQNNNNNDLAGHVLNPVNTVATTTTNAVHDIIDTTTTFLYRPMPNTPQFGKKIPFPFFLNNGVDKKTANMSHFFAFSPQSPFFIPSSHHISAIVGLLFTPGLIVSFKNVQRQLMLHDQVKRASFDKLLSTFPLQNRIQNTINTNKRLNVIAPQSTPYKMNSALLTLMSAIPLVSHNNNTVQTQFNTVANLTTHTNNNNNNNILTTTLGTHLPDDDYVTSLTQIKSQFQQNITHLGDINNKNNNNNNNINTTTNKKLTLNNIPLPQLNQFHNHPNIMSLRQQLNTQLAESTFFSNIGLTSTIISPAVLSSSIASKLSLKRQLRRLKIKTKRQQQRMRLKIATFYHNTFTQLGQKPQYLSPQTLEYARTIPMKPPTTLLEYPLFKTMFEQFEQYKLKQKQKMRKLNKKVQKRAHLLTSQSTRTMSTLHRNTPRNINIANNMFASEQNMNAMLNNSNNNDKIETPFHNSLSKTLYKSHFLTNSTQSKSRRNISTSLRRENNTKKGPHSTSQRNIRFMPTPRTEKLGKTHLSEHVETTPFHYHVSDSLRAVTKFAYMRLGLSSEKLRVQKVRPVLMPFWGFQGTMTITHKPSQTKKVIDYTDVEKNMDTTMYSNLLNVKEDSLVFGMSSQHLVNPNCSFGQEFLHKETDMVGRKAETYANQPHTINTLRMRAQQMFSGSEWAPWQMEGLKVHLHMAQDYKDEFLRFPEDPLYPPNFEDFDAKFNDNDKKTKDDKKSNVLIDDEAKQESPLEHAQQLRDGISPLSQTYSQTCALERAYPHIASTTRASPKSQKGIALETDEHIRSERACFIESMVNMVTLEYNLIQRGVGVTTNQEYLSKVKIDELNLKHGNVPQDRDPMNEALADTSDPKALYDGAFLSLHEQREMLTELAKIHHKMQGPADNNNSLEKNPLHVHEYQAPNSSIVKAHKYFKAIIPTVNKNDDNGNKPPAISPNTDPIELLQSRLLNEDLDIKYNEDNNNKQKKNIRVQQKEHRKNLRKNITNAFLHSPNGQIPTASQREVTFDIPNSDYSVSFSGITSRKALYPGYIHHYNYLGENTIISSAVTGVSTGVPHRHYKSVIKQAIKNTLGAGIGAAGLKLLLRRVILPPVYTVAATVFLIMYSLREIVSGHFRYSKDYYEHSKVLEQEYQIEQQLYFAAARQQYVATGKVSQYEHPTADTIRDAWEFHPYNGFYTSNNWKAENIWNAINKQHSSADSYKQKAAQQRHEANATAARDKKYEEMKRKTEEMERMKTITPIIPTDPYLLILGEEYLGIKPNRNKKATNPTLKLSQVSQIPFDVLKAKYLEQIKYWHPDTHTVYSPEYASERTRLLFEAWNKINNKTKKDSYDRSTYR